LVPDLVRRREDRRVTLDVATQASRLAGRVRDQLVELERLTDELLDDKLDGDVQIARAGILSAIERLDRHSLAGGEPELEVLA
jgi:hypothetical protein